MDSGGSTDSHVESDEETPVTERTVNAAVSCSLARPFMFFDPPDWVRSCDEPHYV